jgi:tripartite-type tricarboxylate transporter receptor subunit TctC
MAQPYPSKPVRIVAGYPAGSGVDVAARIIGLKLTERLGQQFVVDNRGGAGGNIAAGFVAKAPADGYTLLFTNNALTVNPHLYSSVPYDLLRDFEPVTLGGTSAQIMVAHPSFPAGTIKQVIALAKARPSYINLASAGSGSGSHLAGVLLQHMTGISVVHVPYKGAPAALTDLISGQVDLYVSGMPPALAMIRAERVKAIAVTTLVRSAAAPTVPTISESGVPGYDVPLWYGLFAPGGTSAAIVRRLNAEVVASLNLPDVKERFIVQGVDPTSCTQAELLSLIKAESERWAKLIKAAGIKAD